MKIVGISAENEKNQHFILNYAKNMLSLQRKRVNV